MDSFGLYEDFPLFNGDLLEGFPLLANEEPATKLPEQDGFSAILKTSTIEAPAPAVVVPKTTAKAVLGHPQQGSADLGLADLLASSPTKDLAGNPLESAWMDTKVDLLDLLTGDQDATPPSMSVAAPAQTAHPVMSRPTLLQLPGSPVGLGAAVVPSTSVPTTPEPAMEDNSLQGSLDLLQNLLSADVKVENLDLHPVPQEQVENAVYLPEQDLPFSSLAHPVEGGEGEDILMDLDATGLEDLLSASLDASINEGPILSPVSADDVESILSSSPPSPGNGLTSFIDTLDASQNQLDSGYNSLNVSAASEPDSISVVSLDNLMDPAPGPEPTAKEISARPAPYAKSGGRRGRADRKERKKEQNRSAALRYRQKKKEEKGSVQDECDELEERNKELKEKVDSISREINYLKDLLAEVYKARGVVPNKQLSRIMKKK